MAVVPPPAKAKDGRRTRLNQAPNGSANSDESNPMPAKKQDVAEGGSPRPARRCEAPPIRKNAAAPRSSGDAPPPPPPPPPSSDKRSLCTRQPPLRSLLIHPLLI
ncbi:hypothetical protein Ga0100231_003720 [Opitutaceae bacterium TAV4]|nr:hypothetical protein Ga0100231_003720 [Opitutaceae bacterium TAV4]